MLTPRENMMAIFNGERPDYVGDFMAATRMPPDPVYAADQGPHDGTEYKDSWGTVKVFPVEAPGAHPHITPENVVIKDILDWRESVVFPPIEDLDWSPAVEYANSIDRNEYFVTFRSSPGLFERTHFLMGMEDAFCAYLEEPEEMEELLTAIADWKIRSIVHAAKLFHPDAIFYQDDWGSKQNLFLPPTVWRELIKPQQQRISDVIHECGMLYVHHSDCYCQPIVEDMVEIGIDIWQGVIPENDIVAIQEITQGKLAMIGGIDVPGIDIEGMPEETIRAEVRRAIDTYCERGRFYPGMPAGACYIPRNNEIANDELIKYGKAYVDARYPLN